MNTITITGTRLVVRPRGLDRVWGFRRKIDVLLAHVRGATVDPEARREARGLRGPGLSFFGKYVGTFHRNGERTYWNVSGRGTAIVIELVDEHFARLIVSVEDAAALVDRINDSATV